MSSSGHETHGFDFLERVTEKLRAVKLVSSPPIFLHHKSKGDMTERMSKNELAKQKHTHQSHY